MVIPIYRYLVKPDYFLDETHLFQVKRNFLGLSVKFKK